MTVSDAPIVVSFTDYFRGTIYSHNIFIVQATGAVITVFSQRFFSLAFIINIRLGYKNLPSTDDSAY
jgi:hypothetical protein